MSEENGNKKAEKDHFFSCGCVFMIFVGIAFIAIMLAISYFSYSCEEKKDDMNSGYVDDDSSPSGIEQIKYRDVMQSDIEFWGDSDLTSATVVIQANNDIEEFSATVQLCDENGLVLQSKSVTYKNMVSGSRYEVYFALSISDRFDLSIYRVVDISGKVRR